MISHLLTLLAGIVVGSFLPFVKTGTLAFYAFVKAKLTKTPPPPPSPLSPPSKPPS